MTSTTSAPDSFLPLAEMTVNLASSDAVMRLRLELAVPSGQESTVEEVEVHIRDAFVGFLRQVDAGDLRGSAGMYRSEEHTSELQSLMRISYAVFCLKKKKYNKH